MSAGVMASAASRPVNGGAVVFIAFANEMNQANTMLPSARSHAVAVKRDCTGDILQQEPVVGSDKLGQHRLQYGRVLAEVLGSGWVTMLLNHGRGLHAGEFEQLGGFAVVGQTTPLRIGGNKALSDGVRDITNAVGNAALEKSFGAGLKFGRHFSVGVKT